MSSKLKRTGIGCGCLSFLFLIWLVIQIISSFEFPEFEFGTVKTANYKIDVDSLNREKKINSSLKWNFVSNNFGKKRYTLQFKLLEKEVIDAMNLIERIGNMSVYELGLNPRLDYRDPEIQAKVLWTRIYSIVYNDAYKNFDRIVNGFNNIFKKEKFNASDKLLFTTSFVQHIKYERPGGSLDLLAPMETLADMYGDCDTKSILLYVLLEKMGYDCAMMWSSQYKHAMLGIYINASGSYKKISGKKYYFLETTYPGWHIGQLPPDFSNTSYWFISEIESMNGFILKEDNPYRERKSSNRSVKPEPAR